MAIIDTSLNNLMIPALPDFNPDFGTKKASGGLATGEVNSNILMPFSRQRPFIVTEDNSSTTVVESDSKIVLDYSLNYFKFLCNCNWNQPTIYSTNGINWVLGGTFPEMEGSITSVTYGKNKFVAISESGYTAFSIDGINWILGVKVPGGTRFSIWYFITYGNGKFIAADNSGSIAYSTDGINWLNSTMPQTSYWTIIYGNGKFVGAGQNVIAYSIDGVNWGVSTTQLNGTSRLTYGNGKFIIYASFSYGDYTYLYSIDGINWVAVPIPDNSWTQITYGNGKFVVIVKGLQDSSSSKYSTDGINWVTGGTLPNTSGSWFLTYGNGKFVAISTNGITKYSTDGINWVTGGTLPNSNMIYDLIYGEKKKIFTLGQSSFEGCKVEIVNKNNGVLINDSIEIEENSSAELIYVNNNWVKIKESTL